jgi:hypothetical protein
LLLSFLDGLTLVFRHNAVCLALRRRRITWRFGGLFLESREKESAVRIHTAFVTTAAIVAIAVPAVAGAAPPEHHYVPTAVVTSFYPGTIAVTGSCTMTLIAGHVSSFRCPGSTQSQASGGRCTLTVAAGHLWTYSCPAKAGGAALQGASRGAIPSSCRTIVMSGYRWTFSCSRTAFDGR